MRRLRIALLSRWYWEENRRAGTVAGGPTQQLAEAVSDLGHEVIVLSQSPRVTELAASQIGSLEVWLSPREKRADFLTAMRDKWAKRTYAHRKVHSDVRDLAAFQERTGPFDVVWAHAEEPDGLVAAMARHEGVFLPPLLVQIQALRYRFEEGRPVFNQGPALRLAFRGADRILANSELVAASMAAYAGGSLTAEKLRAKVRVVYPNLTDEIARAAGVTALEPEPLRVLFFGALNDKKGALTFLQAILHTAAEGEGAVFVVAGGTTAGNTRFDFRWEQALARVRESVPAAHLEILGRVSAEEAIRQIQRASVVVLPSLFDEFSRALVEVLALGRPVVSTRTVGAWPLVEQHRCGLIVEPNDSVALARAIDEVLRPGSSFAAQARQCGPALMEEFSPRAIARQMGHHLEEISARPATNP